MIGCYEFIDVLVKDETVQARPVAWDREIYDGEGNDIKGVQCIPTEFQATCPKCGNMVHFHANDIFVSTRGDNNIGCGECGAAGVPIEAEAKKPIQPKKIIFLDPIADGLFDVEVDLDRLKLLDLAKFD